MAAAGVAALAARAQDETAGQGAQLSLELLPQELL
jgi:hypothetical protein